MELLFAVFFLLFLYKIKFGVSDEFMSKDYTTFLRGVCALAIMLCHIRITNFAPLNVFNYLGNPIVGIFFFLSGYGMLTRIKQIGIDNYMNGFILKRCVPLFVEYIFVWIFNFVCMFLVSGNFNFLKEIITPHSWFIIMIEVLYIVFYIGYKLFKDNLKGLIIFVTIFELAVIIALSAFGVDECWYLSLLCFSGGMIYSVVNLNEKKTLPLIFGFGALAVVATGAEYVLSDKPKIIVLWALIYNVSVLSLAIVALSVGRYVRFKNPVFELCGKMSLEIYLLHGVFQFVFKEIKPIYNNSLLYGAMIILCTLLMSYGLMKLKTLKLKKQV
ncbi:acyltransferase [uncultured Eubacterium sp.]|uniref:acyltransferase family protein n=1 Tax=uncultured Eubacterium sp. TaxID=165185 RepID=UPI0025FAEE52|nr:acyltransferase [uncultured Eubacterium sp.]